MRSLESRTDRFRYPFSKYVDDEICQMIEIGDAQSIAHRRVLYAGCSILLAFFPGSHKFLCGVLYPDLIATNSRRTVLKHDVHLPAMTRRQVLQSLAAAGGCALLPAKVLAAGSWQPKSGDEAFLDDLERQGCLFFWEQASEKTGQVLDRARNDLDGARDPRRMASIAATGFGLDRALHRRQARLPAPCTNCGARQNNARLAPE